MTAADPALRLRAPAKVNLYLHVTGRRADGYHLLDSLVVFTELGDILDLRPAAGFELTVSGPFADRAGPADDNLVLRAARALADAAGVESGMAAHLVKNIPAAAGLGGGSADAAAALRGLMQLWEIEEDVVDLPRLALQLGADLPACLCGKPVFVGGIGEELEPAPPLPQAGLLLVNPGIALSTPAVFAGRRGGFSPPARFRQAPETATALAALLAERGNDLAAAATGLLPVVAETISTLENLPGCRLARMSGSGATCFGLFDDATAAQDAAAMLKRPGWWVAATRFADV